MNPKFGNSSTTHACARELLRLQMGYLQVPEFRDRAPLMMKSRSRSIRRGIGSRFLGGMPCGMIDADNPDKLFVPYSRTDRQPGGSSWMPVIYAFRKQRRCRHELWPNLAEAVRIAGTYAGRILKGRKPLTCRCSGPRALRRSPTSRPPRRSASLCRRHRSHSPMR